VSIVVRNITHNIKLKRVYDPPADDDGRRILATRYWPRGVSRSATDEYLSKLAPSRELINQYRQGDVRWPEFGVRYRQELSNDTARTELRRLALLAQFQVITLLCFCEDEKGCHRTLLREAIIDAASSYED
jgi:uncharacterized protein YeaO (DUF488 family)